jgi:hypothetical protein
MGITEGTRYGDYYSGPDRFHKMSDYGLREGDLVQLGGQGVNGGGIIFRIVKDCPPRADARWSSYTYYNKRGRWGCPSSWGFGPNSRTKGRTQETRTGWCDAKRHVIPHVRLDGCLELVPVFSFAAFKEKKHVISYNHVKTRVKRVDLLALASNFAALQLFINQELKRLSGD